MEENMNRLQHSRKQPLSFVVVFVALLATTLHQGFANDAPPTAPVTQISVSASLAGNPGQPERGNYTVTNSNGSTCLMACMGLQLNLEFTSANLNKTVLEVVNLQPNVTKSSGSCEGYTATLNLTADDEKTNLTFFFSLNSTSSKYHLSGIALTASWPDMRLPSDVINSSLDYFRGTLGGSYMCREEQTLDVVQNFSLSIFQLQVQPFGLTGTQFGAAEECQMDDDDILIPIMVGTSLAGLVLIVLVAYLIGRRRSQAGYQTI